MGRSDDGGNDDDKMTMIIIDMIRRDELIST